MLTSASSDVSALGVTGETIPNPLTPSTPATEDFLEPIVFTWSEDEFVVHQAVQKFLEGMSWPDADH